MSTRLIIAIDVDDVLAVENEAVRLFANEHYGHTHTAEDYMVPGEYWGYWEKIQGVDPEEFGRRYGEYVASGAKGRLRVVDGALEMVRRLKRDYELVIVTSREAHMVEITHEWLNTHFPATFKRVEFVALWSGSVQGSKADICAELGAQYLIDDHVGHIELAVEQGIKGLLFGHYGWNHTAELPKQVVRVQNWQAVGEYFYGTH